MEPYKTRISLTYKRDQGKKKILANGSVDGWKDLLSEVVGKDSSNNVWIRDVYKNTHIIDVKEILDVYLEEA